jgi:predicted Zn-dependent protease
MILIYTLLLSACATSPLGRSQLLIESESSMASSAVQAYSKMKQDTPISKDRAMTSYVQCVVRALAGEVVGDWEVTLFDDKEVNAFALPGGKIGVYTGILGVANNQDRLAAVIGHEMSHVLSHHANERASQATLANIGLVVVGLAANQSNPNSQLAVAALGLGVQYGIIMPYSRIHEAEADALGLDIMAKAGFNPDEAPKLWQAMKVDKKQSIPEWLSTHPSDDSRIQALEDRQGEALDLMQAAHAAGKNPHCIMPK